MKKRSLLMILALALSLTLAIGGTLAYLQDTDADVNVMTLGSVYIVQNEQERNEDGDLVEFRQNKPIYPAVYEGTSIPYADPADWVVPNDEAWEVVENNENVLDKFVTVTNTGKSDAYVRTYIAFEVGAEAANDPYMHMVVNGDPWEGKWLTDNGKAVVIEVDDNTYKVYQMTYKNVLPAGETTIPSLKQIYLDKTADNKVVEAYGEDFSIIALSQAVQANGFKSAADALDTAFPMGDDSAETLATWFGGAKSDISSPGGELPEGNIDNNPPKKPNGDEDSVTVEIPTDAVKVADNAALDDAIKAGATKIVLTGNGAYIIPDSAQGKTLEIYGDGNQTIEIQDDGSYEGCDYSLDGATVTFNNVIISTDSSAYAGYARCVATYNNCVIDGTVTLFGDAKFNYCTLEATGDVYNVWTWGANNVVFDHCTFNNDGKALLVYNSNCDVTVSNCVFNDSEDLAPVKAAIETGVDNTNTFYNIIVNNVEVNGYAVNTTGYTANTSKLWANKNNMDRAHLNVVVDGVDEY